MLKKLLSAFMVICLLAGSLPVTAAMAADTPDISHIIYIDPDMPHSSKPFVLCDNTNNFYCHTNSEIVLDTNGSTDGLGCVRYNIGANDSNIIYVAYSTPVSVDATGFSHVELDLYFSNVTALADCDGLIMELSSGGECDVEEISFSLGTDFQKGWNHLSFVFTQGAYYSSNNKQFDISSVNYMRIYGFTNSTFKPFVIKIDNVYFTDGNGGKMPNQNISLGESVTGYGYSDGTVLTLDTQNKVAGNASVSYRIGTNTNNFLFVQYVPSEPIDASGLTHVEMDVYVEDDEFLSYVSSSQLEFTSSGGADNEEVTFDLVSKLKKGWTHVVFPLKNGAYNSASGVRFDQSKINYMRFYALFQGYTVTNVVLNFDNIAFTNGDGVTINQVKKGDYKGNYLSSSVPQYGDIDQDGNVSSIDALMVLQKSVEKLTFTNAQLIKSDVNNDAEISSDDALMTLQKSVEKIEQFDIETGFDHYKTSVTEVGIIGSHLVRTHYYTDTAVVADADVVAFGAVGDGVHDDYPAFQAALDYAESLGCGTIFVPVGTYKITRALRIPEGVTLRGDAPIITDGKAGEVKGTVLYAYTGRNNANGPAFIQMFSGSGLQNISIFYPEQDPNNIVPYSYTVKQMAHYGLCINNVNFVNSYNGIQFGPNTNSLQNVVNVTGTILNTGLFMDYNVDICRMENIHFGPKYWIESGLTQFNASSKNALIKHTKLNSIGFNLQHIDWIYLSDITLDSMLKGLYFRQSEREGATGGPNGQVYNYKINDCNVGICCEYINPIGMIFTNGYISAKTPVYCGEKFVNSITINSTEFVTNGGHGVKNIGVGDITLDKCAFTNESNNTSTAIGLTAGSVAVTNCQSKGYTVDISLTDGAKASRAVNFNTEATLKVYDLNNALDKVWDADYSTPDYVEEDYRQQLITRPSGDGFIDINQYEYSGDTSKGISDKLQSAIDDLYRAGGGVVYFPAGYYTLDQAVTVKEGVEVRGTANAPHHSQANATVFYTDFGRCQTEAEAEKMAALFTLKSKAGVSGFKVIYSGQYKDKVFVPYSHSIRGDGFGVYINNVTVANPYYGVDLYTNKCDGHVVNGYDGSPLKTGVVVGGNSTKGIVKNCQLICHFYSDNPYLIHGGNNLMDQLRAFQDGNFECYVVKETVDQILFNNFTLGTKSGIVIDQGADAFILTQGVDASVYAMTARGKASKPIPMINTQLVSTGTVSDRCYIKVDDTFDGIVNMIQTNMWGDPEDAIRVQSGKIVMSQGTLLRSGNYGVRITGKADFTLSGMCFRQGDSRKDFLCTSESAKMIIFANRYIAGEAKVTTKTQNVKSTDF